MKHEIDSIFSKSFCLDNTNIIKTNKLINKAEAIRTFKNEVSDNIHNNPLYFIELGVYNSMTYFKSNSKYLNGQDEQNAIEEVFNTYKDKLDKLNNKIKFYLINIKPSYYKKDGRKLANNNRPYYKNDFKSFEKTTKETSLTKTLTYLAKYGSKDSYDYLLTQLELITDNNKILFYQDIIKNINKFGFERLLNLALLKRNNIKNKLFKNPHIFTSLNFRTVSRVKTEIVGYNKNRNSVIEAFINIGGYAIDISDADYEIILNENNKRRSEGLSALPTKSEILSLPVSYSNIYHGNLPDYNKPVTAYTVNFIGDNISIILSKKDKRYIYSGGKRTLGVDVNMKHNMYSDSDGNIIDYDRELINDFVRFLKEIDKKKSHKQKMGLSKELISKLSIKGTKKQDYLIRAITYDLQEKSRQLVDYAINNGYDHIVMEDLTNIGKIFSKSDEFEGIKYSKLWNLLHISTLNDIVKGICYKNGISFSLVQAPYTSQECSCCHNIDKNNRKSQEIFKCTACGFTINADYNSPLNIKYRVDSDVLRIKLLKLSNYNELTPRIISRSLLKDIIINCSESLSVNSDS